MTAIVIATKNGYCLPVLAKSIERYVSDSVEVYISAPPDLNVEALENKATSIVPNTSTNFGDSYNEVVNIAFEHHSDIVVSNDDVVLTPNTWKSLMEWVSTLKKKEEEGKLLNGNVLGYVACYSDYVRPAQLATHIQMSQKNSAIPVQIIAPIFAWVQKSVWVDFPPINWYSDDVQCLDMKAQHYVVPAYVHHVGGFTSGTMINETEIKQRVVPPMMWLSKNRPELYHRFYLGLKESPAMVHTLAYLPPP